MDPSLEVLLDALERLDAPTSSDRVSVLETLCAELPRLWELTPEDWAAKLPKVENDVLKLGQEADRAASYAASAARRYEQGQRGLETLSAFASRRRDGETRESGPASKDKWRHDPRSTTRNAVLGVMRQKPSRHWSPQLVYEELRMIGHPATRSSVQSALQRLAAEARVVRKVGAGLYRLTGDAAEGESHDGTHATSLRPANDEYRTARPESWLEPDILRRLAEDAKRCFIANHPDAPDSDDLVREAERRVGVWIKKHEQEPYDEGHVRRLMKTALDDHYRRTQKNGSEAKGDEGVPS